ncbi:MAG: AbrB/MazE/SpoVT family DNA-binding domain-containing protein [Promethearchaeota archaeon]
MSKFSKNNYFFGSVKVGERGQIVIPAKAREIFKIEAGDQILVFGDIKKGIGLIKATELKRFMTKFFTSFNVNEGFENENSGSDNNGKSK